MVYGISKLDRSIVYKILQTMWMWFREKPVLKPLNYVNTPPQQTHSHLFQCAKVINCCMGPQDHLEIWLINTHPNM